MDINILLGNMLKLTDFSKIIIWGGGIRGIALLEALNKLNFGVYAFADNSESKQREGIRGYQCFSKEQLLVHNSVDDFCIIVSVFESNILYTELLSMFKKVFPHEVCEIFFSASVLSKYKGFVPIGHFYSLYPDLEEIEKSNFIIYDKNRPVKDINMREEKQVNLFATLMELSSSAPAWDDVLEGDKKSKFRYSYHNFSFSHADAITLHCILRHLKPRRMIEVGSGWSSAVSLDTNEFYLDKSMDITFIEPYPNLLNSITKNSEHINLIEKGLQEVPFSIFDSLEAGDLLFIDSTHVSKIGSDVNYLFFELFPHLKSGVYIHLHDIFYPFEYPKEWIDKGRIWNELYVFRAFLQNNNDYEILYFQNMIEQKYSDIVSEKWLFKDPFYGGSFYMKKL